MPGETGTCPLAVAGVAGPGHGCQSGPGWAREAGPGHGREVGPGCQGKPGPAPWLWLEWLDLVMAASLVSAEPERLGPVMAGPGHGWTRSWLPVWSQLGPGGWPRSWEGGRSWLPRETRTCPPTLVVRLVSVAGHASLQSWRCVGHKYTQWTREAATPTQMHSLYSLIEVKVARGKHDQTAYNKGCDC